MRARGCGKVLRMAATIETATSVTDELVEAFAMLIPQLSSSNPPPSRAQLQEIVSSPACVLFVAKVEGTVELTSGPSREAANRLYLRIGFEKRETNVYRYSL